MPATVAALPGAHNDGQRWSPTIAQVPSAKMAYRGIDFTPEALAPNL